MRPTEVYGRDVETRALRRALDGGSPVVVWAPPGFGRTTFLTNALRRHPTALGHGMGTLAFRPYLALEAAVRCEAPTGSPTDVASWVLRRLGGAVLAIDDAHLVHPSTLAVLGMLAGRVPIVVTVATGQLGSGVVADTLGRWPLPPHRIDLGRLDPEAAAALVRSRNQAFTPAEVSSVVDDADRVPTWLVTGAHRHTADRVEDAIASMPVEARTALAVAALLGRPAPPVTFGPGADLLVRLGVASVNDRDELDVIALVARTALGRVPEPQRAALHSHIADQLDDPGERARHLAAAARNTEAAIAATAAAHGARLVTEAGAHLQFAVTVDPTPDRAAAAVSTLIQAGDVGAAASITAHLDHADVAHALLSARANRFAGNTPAASAAVASGLAIVTPGTPPWRELLIEAIWVSPPGTTPLPTASIVDACAGTEQFRRAKVAAILATAAFASSDAITIADLEAFAPPERFHTGLIATRVLLRLGDAAAAAKVADEVAELAERDNAGTWVDVARVEAAWCRYLHSGSPDALEAVTVLLEATLLDATRDRARALVHLGMIDRDPTLPALPDGTSGSGLWAAVAAEAHLAVDDLGAAATQAAIVGPSAGDPVAAYLAGPAALIAAARWGAPTPDLGGYEILRSEATARSSNVPADLEEVSRQWSSIAARGVVRCTLELGTAQARADAAQLAGNVGLARWADRCGAKPTGDRDDLLTGRERQVLELVGAGCTTPTIARRLGIAASTVDSHIRSAKTKLGVSTRAAAVGRLA